MTYRPTLLNISTAVFLIWVLIYTIWNYKTLLVGEGWGVIAMFGLAGIGIIAALADLLLQKLIKNRIVINVIGAIIVIGLVKVVVSDL